MSDYVPGGATATFAPMFPDIVVTTIDGAGHWVHADKPGKFVEAVKMALTR
jgi:esterase